MPRSDLIRGFSGICLAWLCVGTACSSSDGPTTTPEGDGGAGLAHGGASGAQAQGGKGGQGGKAGGKAGQGGKAGSSSGGSAGHADTGTSAGAETAGSAEPQAGSGGESDGGCQPSNDRCPEGQYCSSTGSCVDGCKSGDSCASGVCGADHDCQSCTSDQECAEPHVCGAGQCASACSAAQEGTNDGCGTGLTCCSQHCISTVSDQQHCGACGTACADTEFCGQSGCVSTQLSSICRVGKLVVILDGQPGDDPKSRELAQVLVDHCPTSQTVREVSQTSADALNPSNGHPVSGSDELLLIAGSSYFQKGADYMVLRKLAPLINLGNQGSFEIRDSSTNALIASELSAETSDSNDLFAVEIMREPVSGSLLMNAFGFSSGGTAAATFYFAQAIMPDLASATKAWYVGKWTDTNANGLPDLSEFTLIASGG